MQLRVKLLGNCINKEGIYTNERKVQTVRDTHPPSTRKILRSFLGLASSYRRFIKNFAKIARTLSENTSGKFQFEWTMPTQKSFEMLKRALAPAPVLVNPDFSKPLLVATDSSSAAIGAVCRSEMKMRSKTRYIKQVEV